MPVSRSKQSARATPMGSLRLLCALSPISRLYFSLGLSTRTSIFVDRSLNFVLASTEIPVFMDRIAESIVVSMKTALFVDRNFKLTVASTQTALFVDSSRFRWREYGRQATRLANMPASRSKQTVRATPKGSRSLLCAPSQILAHYLV